MSIDNIVKYELNQLKELFPDVDYKSLKLLYNHYYEEVIDNSKCSRISGVIYALDSVYRFLRLYDNNNEVKNE